MFRKNFFPPNSRSASVRFFLQHGAFIWFYEVVLTVFSEREPSFVTMDLTKGLDAYRESVELVHCRCVAGHVSVPREVACVNTD